MANGVCWYGHVLRREDGHVLRRALYYVVQGQGNKGRLRSTCECEGNIGEAVEQEEKLYDEVETVREFTCLDDRVSAGGGCEAAVTVRTRCGWVKFMECRELLYGRRFPLRLKGAIYKTYVRPAALYGSEALCLKESEIGILCRAERSMVRAMCGVQLKEGKRSTDFMFILGLSETMDQLAMANSVHWHGDVLRR